MTMERPAGLRELRERAELGLSDFAARLEVSTAAVGKWERGDARPDVSRFPRIAELLGITVEEVVSLFASGSRSSAGR